MKRFPMQCRIMVLLFLLLCMSGCGTVPEIRGNQPFRVVTTVFPYYDFARQIAVEAVREGAVEVTLVIPAGMDSHSFEPTPADMRMIQDADLLICNGGAMEHWLEEVLDAVDTSEMTILTMMDYVDIVEEETVEGMETAEAADHGGHREQDSGSERNYSSGYDREQERLRNHDGHEMEIEYDEHIWTSPVNAMKMTEVIRDCLIELKSDFADSFRIQSQVCLRELEEIDQAFRQVSADRKRSMIVVGDKFPFRYLADAYDLDYRAAFTGCSTDTEPSARTIAYLIDKVRQEQIPVVYYLELSSSRVAEIIGEETGAEPLLLHSCHNVTRAQFERGITYGELMRQNVENLRKGIAE